MKRFLFFILVLVLSATVNAKEKKSYQIFTNSGKQVDFSKMLKATEGKKYIFFGEYHNNPISHWLQYELMRELHALYKKKLIVGGEMFEADNQYIIDEYLKGQISTKNFQDEVRLWPNYNTDYKPIIEYAKANGIPFIATNIPRRYANMVYKKGLGALNDLSDLAKSYIVPLNAFEFDSTVTCYADLMDAMGGHGGLNMATAQAIKDATMAHFIYKNKTAKSVFLHLNGAYHSDNYEGIVHYLKKYVKTEEILTITTVEQKEIDKLRSANKGNADFIICVPESMTKTH